MSLQSEFVVSCHIRNVVGKPLVQMFAEFKVWAANRIGKGNRCETCACLKQRSPSISTQGTHYDFENIVEKSEVDDWYLGEPVACMLQLLPSFKTNAIYVHNAFP